MTVSLAENMSGRVTHQSRDAEGSMQCIVTDLLLDSFDLSVIWVLMTGASCSDDVVHFSDAKVIKGVEDDNPHDVVRRIAGA